MRQYLNKESSTLAVYGLILTAGVIGFILAAGHVYGLRTPDRQGCFSGVPQAQSWVLVDASEPRFDADQRRSLRRYFARLNEGLGFNERLAVYTSETDQLASIPKARFAVCGQARTAEELSAINAGEATAGYLRKQRERLFTKRFVPELDALISPAPDSARVQRYQSPLMEMLADLSRAPELASVHRLILVSDLMQNTPDARFCHVKNHMPSFATFSRRAIYHSRMRPAPYTGMAVEVLMLQRPAYGPYCTGADELKAFWRDYFRSNGARSVRFTLIRHAVEG